MERRRAGKSSAAIERGGRERRAKKGTVAAAALEVWTEDSGKAIRFL